MPLAVTPVRTWVRGFDEPIVLGFVAAGGDYTVRVYRDRVDPNNLLWQGTVARGAAEYEVAAGGQLPPNQDVKLVVTAEGPDSLVLGGEVPARWGRNDPYATVLFVDENNNPLDVSYHFIDLRRGLYYQGTGPLAWRAPVLDGVMAEVTAQEDGRKYYYAFSPVETLEPGRSYRVRLRSSNVFYVRVTYRIDLRPGKTEGIAGLLSRFAAEAADLLAYIGAELTEKAFVLARMVSKAFGINLPIVGVEAERAGGATLLHVTYAQDATPISALLVRILPYILAALVVGGVTIVAYKYVSVQPEIAYYNAMAAYYNYLAQKAAVQERMVEGCRELAGNKPDYYLRCINAAQDLIEASASADQAAAEAFSQAASKARGESDKYKTLAVAAGAFALGALLLRRG